MNHRRNRNVRTHHQGTSCAAHYAVPEAIKDEMVLDLAPPSETVEQRSVRCILRTFTDMIGRA